MDKRKVVRTDFFVQAALIIIAIGAFLSPYKYGSSGSVAVVCFVLFVIWQFFSNIYIATEFKMRYRFIPPVTFLLLVIMAFALDAYNVNGILSGIAFLLIPIVLLGNLVLAGIDWYRLERQHAASRWHPDKDRILDTEDIFIDKY